jgi:hypothetical protein
MLDGGAIGPFMYSGVELYILMQVRNSSNCMVERDSMRISLRYRGVKYDMESRRSIYDMHLRVRERDGPRM